MRLMLVAMSTYADDNTGERIRPSMKTLVSKSGLNAGHANRTIRRLLAEGWIEVVGERSKGGSKAAVTEYRICLERLQGECAAHPLRSAPPAHAHDDPLRSARAAPAQRTRTPCAAHTDPSVNPSVNPSPPPISDAGANEDAPKAIVATNLPPILNTQAFSAAWAEWEQHRREIRKPLSATSTRQQLTRLAGMGQERAIAAIRHSIGNGWQGIFEPLSERSSNGAAERRAEQRGREFAEPVRPLPFMRLDDDSGPAAMAAADEPKRGGGLAAPPGQKAEDAITARSNGTLRLHRPGEPIPLPDGAHPPKRDPAAEARAATLAALEQAGIDDAAERNHLADMDGMTAKRVRDWRALLRADAAPETIFAWIEGQAGKAAEREASAAQRIAERRAAQGIAAGVG